MNNKFWEGVVCVVMALVVVVPVYAAVPSEDVLDMFDTNGVYYYNPDGDNGCVSTATRLRGNDVPEKIWNFFIDAGFNDAQAAGILGNAWVESNFEVTRSSSGSFWGIFQWGGGRKDNVFARVKEAGLEEYLDARYWPSGASAEIPAVDADRLLQVELEYALSEPDYNWQDELKLANTPEVAAEVFLVLFERAVGGDEEVLYYSVGMDDLWQGASRRREYAVELYQQYSGSGDSVASSPTATLGADVTVIGDSLSVGAEGVFREKFPELAVESFDAVVGRSWAQGAAGAPRGTLKDVVVFALGSNSPSLTEEDIGAVVEAVGAERRIVFVTNYGPLGYEGNNALMKAAAGRYENVAIADWAMTVAETPEVYLADDGLHLSAAGNELFVETIFKAVNSNTNENGCSVSGEFTALVKGYAWPSYHEPRFVERMPMYAEAVTMSMGEGRYYGGTVAGVPGIDCGGFVTILMQNSGLESLYNTGSNRRSGGDTTAQENWVINNGWTLLNESNTAAVDTSVLRAGDVAFSGGTGPDGVGHTFVYVGEIAGFDSVIASASYSTNGGGRAPMAGEEDLVGGSGSIVRWYRRGV